MRLGLMKVWGCIITLATHPLTPYAFPAYDTIVQGHLLVGVGGLWKATGLRAAVDAIVPVPGKKSSSTAVSCRRTPYRSHPSDLTL